MQQQAPPITRNKLGSETATLKVGDRAPDFKLKAHDARDISLSDLRGKRVVIGFFHFAFTGT